MLSLIFRKKSDNSTVESTRLNVEAPVYMNITDNGEVVVDNKKSNSQVVIEKQGDTHYLTTDINKVCIDGKHWILPQIKVEKLQSTLHEIEVFLESVLNSFKEKIPFTVTVDKEVKYVEEIIGCFNGVLDKNQQLNNLDIWIEKIENLEDADFSAFRKELMSEMKFEDYDRTNTQKDVHVALERKRRYLLDKKIMFLNMNTEARIDEDTATKLQGILTELEEQNKEVDKLKDKFIGDYPELKVWAGIDTLDTLTKHFKKLLTEDKSNRTLAPGEYVHTGNFVIEISNIIDPEKSHPWNKPFDPELTYKDVDDILETVKNSDFIHESKLNYIKHRLGKNYTKEEQKEREQELVDDVVNNLSTIRNLIRFDCKILKFEQGTQNKPEIICRKGDFGNSAYFIVSGKVDVVLDHDPIPEEKLGKHNVKKKNLLQSFAQLFSNNHHMNEHRSKSDKNLTKQDHAIFIQDFDQILENQNVKVVTRLGAGNMFGEISAMGRTPRTATIVANEPVILMEIRWQGLRDLRENISIIKEITDANFRERGLDVHIRATSIFKDLSEYERKDLEQDCLFKSYGDFKWNMTYKDLAKKGELSDLSSEPIITSEGDYPDSLFLIRSGFARVSRNFNNGHLTENYLGKGAIFGLEELKHNYENPHAQKNHKYSLRSIGYLDAIEVPKHQVIKHIFENDPASKRLHDENLGKAGETIVIQPVDKISSFAISENKVDQGLIESLVGGRIVNGTKTMLINLDRCTRCDDCVVACSNAHNGNPRFLRHGRTIDNFMVANACMHCNDPVCMIGCPTGAINRNTDGGQVLINDTACIGCSTCANSCPYDNIRMVEYIEQGTKTLKKDSETGVPLQKATKCDLCIDQPGGPACERACPHDALKRVDLTEINKVEQWLGTYKS